MFVRATRRGAESRRGSVLVGVFVLLLGIMGFLYATSLTSGVDVREARRALDDLRTKELATAGVERGLHFLQQRVDANTLEPLAAITQLFEEGPVGMGLHVRPGRAGAIRRRARSPERPTGPPPTGGAGTRPPARPRPRPERRARPRGAGCRSSSEPRCRSASSCATSCVAERRAADA